MFILNVLLNVYELDEIRTKIWVRQRRDIWLDYILQKTMLNALVHNIIAADLFMLKQQTLERWSARTTCHIHHPSCAVHAFARENKCRLVLYAGITYEAPIRRCVVVDVIAATVINGWFDCFFSKMRCKFFHR